MGPADVPLGIEAPVNLATPTIATSSGNFCQEQAAVFVHETLFLRRRRRRLVRPVLEQEFWRHQATSAVGQPPQANEVAVLGACRQHSRRLSGRTPLSSRAPRAMQGRPFGPLVRCESIPTLRHLPLHLFPLLQAERPVRGVEAFEGLPLVVGVLHAGTGSNTAASGGCRLRCRLRPKQGDLLDCQATQLLIMPWGCVRPRPRCDRARSRAPPPGHTPTPGAFPLALPHRPPLPPPHTLCPRLACPARLSLHLPPLPPAPPPPAPNPLAPDRAPPPTATPPPHPRPAPHPPLSGPAPPQTKPK
jgi:hypothetical protein